MRKASYLAIIMMFGLTISAQAVTSNPNQGTVKPGQTGTAPQGAQTGNVVSTQEQNQVMNQGEETQIRTQDQNQATTQDSGKKDSASGKSGKSAAPEKRSQVANAVQGMLQIAERNQGIGQQVRTIAQNQEQNRVKLEKNIEKIENRGGLAKFLIGPNYGEIKNAQKTLEQNKEQIKELNWIRTQLTNQGDQQQLAEQIMILEGANQEIETLLSEAQKGFSLFGWLNKILS